MAAFQYRSLEPNDLEEKPSRPSSDSSATLHALDDLDLLSQTSELGLYKASFDQLSTIWWRSRWLWVVHAALLLTSGGILALSLIMRSSTLEHVRKYSAWCWSSWFITICERQLILSIAPADNSVRYDHVRYNITTNENPFVGAGPEVDQAWREISYDSESIPRLLHSKV